EVDAEAAVRPEGDELLRVRVLAGRTGRHDERQSVDRPEELAAVGVVVAMPEMDVARRVAIAQHVVAADRLVDPAQLVAAPLAGEGALGGAAFVAGTGIELAMPLHRPRHALDAMRRRIAHDVAE